MWCWGFNLASTLPLRSTHSPRSYFHLVRGSEFLEKLEKAPKSGFAKIYSKKKLGVVHACNPSCLGGRARRIMVKTSLGKVSGRPYLKNKLKRFFILKELIEKYFLFFLQL
jgi:hypothetical protein